MKILVVSQYYFPEMAAASKRITELTRLWVQNGHEVSVITSVPNYPFGKVYNGYENRNTIEEIEGVKVYRNKINISDKRNKIVRLKTYMSFMFNAIRSFEKKSQSYDVIITTIGPVFSGLIGMYISFKIKKPHVLEFRDITYKQMQATNFGNKLTVSIMKKFELFLSKKSKHIVTVTDSYKSILQENGVPKEKISTIYNGFLDIENSREVLAKDEDFNNINSLIEREKLSGNKIIGYFGTLGVSQKIEEFVVGFDKTIGYTLLIIGNGAREEEIKNYINKYKITNVYLYSSINQEYIYNLYSKVDFSLMKIVNSPEFSATIPSKLFEIIGNNGIPLYIGPEGEATKIISSFSNDLIFSSDSNFFEKFETNDFLKLNSQDTKSLAKNLLKEKFDRKKQAIAYIDILNKITKY